MLARGTTSELLASSFVCVCVCVCVCLSVCLVGMGMGCSVEEKNLQVISVSQRNMMCLLISGDMQFFVLCASV